MSRVRGDKLSLDLCEILGISPDNVASLTVECKAGAVAQVVVTRHLTLEEVDQFKTVMEAYIVEAKPGIYA